MSKTDPKGFNNSLLSGKLMALMVLALGLLLPYASHAGSGTTSGTWTSTGSLPMACDSHTATLLPNGQVLVAGGKFSGAGGFYTVLSNASLYKPAASIWSATGTLLNARVFHTATLLPGGKVLVAGGIGSADQVLSSAELYDPVSGNWSATGSLNQARANHTATLLPNGKILVAGGSNNSGWPFGSAELYDPDTGTWSTTGSLAQGRANHTATFIMSINKVLVAGGMSNNVWGSALSSTELYDPVSGNWSAAAPLKQGRYYHTATYCYVPPDQVTVIGGVTSNGSTTASGECYFPELDSWGQTSSLQQDRAWHTATYFPNSGYAGLIVVAGGFSGNEDIFGTTSVTECYDVWPDTWTTSGLLNQNRFAHTATILPDGRILAAGGAVGNGMYNEASTPATEIFKLGISLSHIFNMLLF